MALAPGTHLGPYEILSALGAGGMGEVYRARDTKLRRDVALKILPDTFANDPDRLARFQREAHVLASLNHPNIAHIYGLEDAQGVTALAMELVEGPTLADRIARGPVPIGEALPIAKQIAEALEAAHEQGIIHRDLKPANIKIRPDGAVKVLDFGLAKALEPAGASHDSADSPTITSPAMTEVGMILGTAAYMSPEQAMGKAVDRRADIWAFGVVLYEILTGRRAFEGKEVAEVLASVIKAEPDWTKLPASAPGVRALLTRCLEKDPRLRWRDIADVQFVLSAAVVERSVRHPDRPTARSARIPLFAALAAGAVLLVLGLAIGEWLRLSSPSGVPPLEFVIDPGVATVDFAISADGRQLAFSARSPETGERSVWVRSFSSVVPRQIPGTEGADSVFWSPDSRSVAFFAGGALNAVDVATGTMKRLCGVTGNNWGGSWGRENVIVFSSSDDGTLKHVPAVGGTPVPASRLGPREDSHRLPFFLPDGVHFLYLAVAGGGLQNSVLRVGSLHSTDTIDVGPARTAAMYSAGHLLYVSGQQSTTLIAQPFDVSPLRSSGTPIPVAEGIFIASARGSFSVADSGALAYGQRNSFASTTRLTWIDRRGQLLGTVGEPGVHTTLRLSPDGQRLAFSALGSSSLGSFDLWTLDLTSGRTSRLTTDPGNEFDPAWSPDGSQIVFNSNRNGPYELFRTASQGGGREERLFPSDRSVTQPSWSHDGRWLVYSVDSAGAAPTDLWVVPAAGGTPREFVVSPFSEANAAFSPDDRWVAYTSNASGRREVYVRPFPSGSGEFKVSQHGGSAPAWRGDGRELFFVAPDGTLLGASIGSTQGLQAGVPQPLFSARMWSGVASYVVSKDGSRFLVAVQEPTREETAITVTTNWLPKLGRTPQ